jgi:predicted phosphodiesterase
MAESQTTRSALSVRPGEEVWSGASVVRQFAPILFAGDPHGNFSPILRACQTHPTGTLILLGDCDCPAPLEQILAPLLTAGWQIHWILGNHDTDTEATFDWLTGAPGDLGLRVHPIGGLRFAGLPGVFKPRVWLPRAKDQAGRVDPIQFHTRSDFARILRPSELWRGGLPLWHRDTIFPEDFDLLRSARFDVLVTHEAPSSHRHGFYDIDRLAEDCGARLIVHGHHHQSYEAILPGAITVKGLGLSEVWALPDGMRHTTPG